MEIKIAQMDQNALYKIIIGKMCFNIMSKNILLVHAQCVAGASSPFPIFKWTFLKSRFLPSTVGTLLLSLITDHIDMENIQSTKL